MTRWLITGAYGMLGADLVRRVAACGDEVIALGRGDLDLRDATAVQTAVRRATADVVVNCAAWTAVDAAEINERDAMAVNGDAVRTLVHACAGTRLIHFSTDYVFDGTGCLPYAEDAPPRPVNAYGRTKLAGERAVLAAGGYVVRTAWLYGAAGPNFVRTMLRLSVERDTVDVVDDQHGQPTWTLDLAGQVVRLARSGAPPGAYHGTSSGQTTWYGLAKEIFTLSGLDPARVRPVPSTTIPRHAARPSYSVLGHSRWITAGLAPIRHWREALRAAWPELREA